MLQCFESSFIRKYGKHTTVEWRTPTKTTEIYCQATKHKKATNLNSHVLKKVIVTKRVDNVNTGIVLRRNNNILREFNMTDARVTYKPRLPKILDVLETNKIKTF